MTTKPQPNLDNPQSQIDLPTSRSNIMQDSTKPKQDVSKLLQLDRERHTKLVNILKGYSETDFLIKYLVGNRTLFPD